MPHKKSYLYLKAERLFGVLIIIVGLLGLYILYSDNSTWDEASKSESSKTKSESKTNSILSIIKKRGVSKSKLNELWVKDFSSMKKENLPEEFQEIWKIRVFMLDKNLHFLLEGLEAPIKTKKNGLFNLEVTFMSHYSEELRRDMLIVQYNIIDIETNNMVFEISRQITLDEGFLEERRKVTPK